MNKSSVGERVQTADAQNVKGVCDGLVSKIFSKAIFDTGEEEVINILRQGDAGEGVIVLCAAMTYRRPSSRVKVFVFEGVKTEDELRELREILKSGNYQLPPNIQGTTLPIKGMTRRNDNYGIEYLDGFIAVPSISRDLWFDEDASFLVKDYVTNSSGDIIPSSVARENYIVDGAVVGSDIEITGGRVRVLSPCLIKKVG